MKRKRDETCSRSQKKARHSFDSLQPQASSFIQHSILTLYYQHVCTLGDLLNDWLPPTSRTRRRRLRQFDSVFPQHSTFLTRIVVGFSTRPSFETQISRRNELVAFTQTQRSARGNSHDQLVCNVSEVVDFALWSIFQRDPSAIRTPSHLLCHGYQRAASLSDRYQSDVDLHLPGIVRRVHNANAELFKRPPWTDVANLLGKDAEMIMLSLFLDCGLFQHLDGSKNNLFQLSGKPVTRLRSCVALEANVEPASHGRRAANVTKPGSIVFVRSRMFHGRPSLNGQGKVQLGLKHIHALNRYSDLADPRQDIRIMQYVFPLQCNLHNVFTSRPDPNETVQPLQDYTMREHEINRLEPHKAYKIPRRLRGKPLILVRKLRRNHQQCSYHQLLRHYCPSVILDSSRPTECQPASRLERAVLVTQIEPREMRTPRSESSPLTSSTSFIPYATPVVQVVAFCQAVLTHLLPNNALGCGEERDSNWNKLLLSIDQFIRMRRFESITLHEVCQNFKLTSIEWLRPPTVQGGNRMATSDKSKRVEILQELIYYVFDSLLIPVIRSNFYVTETGVHRNRVHYFRHDVWKKMADPSLAVMRLNMFEPLNSRQLKHNLSKLSLGCGQVRLVPKEHGIRPITNLKRRVVRVVNGRTMLRPSVNTQLAPLLSILNMERQRQPEKLASAMFSVSDIQDKLVQFKARLNSSSPITFYFAKVDITSCFDTIPQDELLLCLNQFLCEQQYQITKHVEMKRIATSKDLKNDRVVSRYMTRATRAGESSLLSPDIAAQLANRKNRHLFVGIDHERVVNLGKIQSMLTNHVKHNVVRIGRKHFRQMEGIPQGSVLSSMLCNLFYGDFERQELSFLRSESSLLLRLIDDFLLITTNETEARSFVSAMSHGKVSHGISVNPDKSLVNFEVNINGHKIPRVHDIGSFPYCGMVIDTRDLQLRKDRHSRDVHVQNGLTVGRSGKVGVHFQNKVVSSLKRQLHGMLLEGFLNTKTQIMASIFECFVETGMKMHQYLRNLRRRQRPTQMFLVEVCRRLVIIGFDMLRRARVRQSTQVSRSQVNWLATVALSKVLIRKQSEYAEVLRWLHGIQGSARESMNMADVELDHMVAACVKSFEDHVY